MPGQSKVSSPFSLRCIWGQVFSGPTDLPTCCIFINLTDWWRCSQAQNPVFSVIWLRFDLGNLKWNDANKIMQK